MRSAALTQVIPDCGPGVRNSQPALPLFRQLLANSVLLPEDWEALPPERRDTILASPSGDDLLARLGEARLLTPYQAARVRSGKFTGMLLGNYRVLERIGTGGMGIVYRGEHVRMRRPVALKVLAGSDELDPRMLTRFFGEIRAIAQLRHPNVVAAVDAGEEKTQDPDSPVLYYFAMEYVPGKDLESIVAEEGPMTPGRACGLLYQVADALTEAHRHGLIHRDIKPSNVLVTPEGQAKLLDFGLALRPRMTVRVTDPGAVLGTVGYMAPEQAQDARTVDHRADLYALGCTLYWCLTGSDPFAVQPGTLAQDLVRRMTQAPPLARALRPDLPPELDGIVARLMSVRPEDRYPSADAVMRVLLPFLPSGRAGDAPYITQPADAALTPANTGRVLIVDDETAVRQLSRIGLQEDHIVCGEAEDGHAALEILRSHPYDLVLLDIDMPMTGGPEVLRQLRLAPPCPNLKIIMLSGRATPDDMAQLLLAGADDFLSKPFSLVQLRARVQAGLRLKAAQDRSDELTQELRAVNAELERGVSSRDGDLLRARAALVLALAKLVEQRSTESSPHLVRLQRYCRTLAETAASEPAFQGRIDPAFIELLECAVPLHDIGKVALPDHILLKPGRLDPEERVLMQAHTIIGAETLHEVARQQGFAMAFLQMAVDIARHHHERYDGTGYPDRLAGEAIPLAARIVAIADVYDALRSRRVYKPALSHHTTVTAITEGSPGQFDPALLTVFRKCAPAFDRVYRELSD
jgi:response regulator RpfG family c-di-GMP phosphodiesterase/serine/threonine protein kinase